MAYDITLDGARDSDGPETFSLCSIGAWSTFGAWVRTLPEKSYSALRAFARAGHFTGTDQLAKDLLDAEAIDPPKDAGVHATLARLIEVVGEAGDPEETATVED